VEFTLAFGGGMHKISVKCIQNVVGKHEDTKQHQGVYKRLIRSTGIRVWYVMTCILRYLRFSLRYCSLMRCQKPRKVHFGFVVDKGGSGAGCLPSIHFFPMSLSLHQCCVLIFVFMLELSEGRAGEASKPSDLRENRIENYFHVLI